MLLKIGLINVYDFLRKNSSLFSDSVDNCTAFWVMQHYTLLKLKYMNPTCSERLLMDVVDSSISKSFFVNDCYEFSTLWSSTTLFSKRTFSNYFYKCHKVCSECFNNCYNTFVGTFVHPSCSESFSTISYLKSFKLINSFSPVKHLLCFRRTAEIRINVK